MPIKPELRKFYGREWSAVIRPAILKRAGNCCEQCRVPNRAVVLRVDGAWCLLDHGTWTSGRGFPQSAPSCSYRAVRIVLTIAHLNHIAGDDRPENLKALCQWHHLNLDKDHHAESRAIRKDATRPLLVGRDQFDGFQPPTEAKIGNSYRPNP